MTRPVPRVLQVVPYLDARAGGPAVVVGRLAEHAGAHGWETHVVSTPAFTSDGGRSLQRAAAGRYRLTLLASQLSGLAPGGRAALREAVANADIVHLHTMWSPLNLAAARACRASGTPYLLAPHGMLDPWSLGRRAFRKRLYLAAFGRALIEGAAAVIFTAGEERDLAVRSVGPIGNATVIALGADQPPQDMDRLAEDFRARHPAIGRRPMLLFLGRLHAKKRPAVAIEAMPAILAGGADAALVFAGSGDPGVEADLRRRAGACGVSERVIFLGHIEGAEKWGALAAADIFVLASQQENFGIAIAEALHAGTPVVITRNVNIWRDVAEAGAGVTLDESRIVDNLGRQVLALLGNPVVRGRMSANARALATRNYTWLICARATCNLYERLSRPSSAKVCGDYA